jgi:hypothetical protein
LRLTIASLAFCLGVPLLHLSAQVRGANEVFPSVNNDSITIRILSGVDGHPIAHAHLSLLAGYNQRDLHLEMWHDDVTTDDQGKVRLPDALANLPFLQLSVAKLSMCVSSSNTFSVDLIRRDGLSTPNRCGNATFADAPGTFTVFVKTKIPKVKPPKPVKPCKVHKPAAKPTPAAAPPPVPPPAPATPAPRVPARTIAPTQPDDLRALAADRLVAIA